MHLLPETISFGQITTALKFKAFEFHLDLHCLQKYLFRTFPDTKG